MHDFFSYENRSMRDPVYDKFDSHSSLSDCGQKACENGGEMQVNSCTCTCKHPPFQIGDSCKRKLNFIAVHFI